MNRNKFIIDLGSVNLDDTQRKELQTALQDSVAASLDSIQPGVVIVSVVFNNGVGGLHAAHIRDGQTLMEKDIDHTGTISLCTGEKDDTLSISGACTGTAGVTINVGTERATPVTFGAGRFSERFDLI